MNELDRKILRIIALLPVGAVVCYITWWYILPITINRRKEIELGNALIKQVEHYKTNHGLPDTDDEQTLIQLGFKIELNGQPTYQRLNDSSFQIFYPKGFDPPYLMWESNKRVWSVEFPEIPDDWK